MLPRNFGWNKWIERCGLGEAIGVHTANPEMRVIESGSLKQAEYLDLRGGSLGCEHLGLQMQGQ